MSWRSSLAAVVAASVVSGATATSHAVPEFSVTVSAGVSGTTNQDTDTGPKMASASADASGATGSAFAVGTAWPGDVRARATGEGSGADANAIGDALAVYVDDFIIFGQAGPVSTSLNFDLRGSLSASIDSENSLANGQSDVWFGGSILGARDCWFWGQGQNRPECLFGGRIISGGAGFGFGLAPPPGPFSVNPSLTLELTTEPFFVPTGFFRTLVLELRTVGLVQPVNQGTPPTGSRQGTSNFSGNSLSLPRSRPVFNLPDGYSVSSASGAIVDNQFVPPNVIPTLPLALVAVLALLMLVAVFTARRRAD